MAIRLIIFYLFGAKMYIYRNIMPGQSHLIFAALKLLPNKKALLSKKFWEIWRAVYVFGWIFYIILC
jgi:hypothetical protein